MKKLRSLDHNQFLRLLFLTVPCCFLLAAILMPDRGQMFTGLWKIISQPSKVSTNYFAVGGFAATFLNSAIVSLACFGIFCLPESKPNQKTILAYFLVLGFTTWGINLLNIIPSFLGVYIYSLIKHKPLGTLVNPMFFSTGLAPLITDLMIRYPYQEVVGIRWYSVLLSLAVGILLGMSMPAGIEHSGKVHKDFDLYSAALPLGLLAVLFQSLLYNVLGLPLPKAPGAESLQVTSPLIVNSFCLVIFLGALLCGRYLFGGTWKQYGVLLKQDNHQEDYLKNYGPGVVLMNFGLVGLTILAYYNLIGAPLNGVTFGCIFCVVSCAGCGSNPKTIAPIMLGYVLASLGFGAISQALGGDFKSILYAQPIAVGLCFATGMSPITGRYGWLAGMVAAALHMSIVTVLPALHGGFCLYNGGFTAALVCLILIPQLERYFGENPRNIEEPVK